MELVSSSDKTPSSVTKIITIHLVSDVVWKNLTLEDLKSCRLVNKLWDSAARDFIQKNLRIKFKIQREFPCESLKEFNDFLSSATPSVSSLFNFIETPWYSGRDSIKCVAGDSELHKQILVEGTKASELFPCLFSKLELKHFHFSSPIGMDDSKQCPLLGMCFKELLWQNAKRLESIKINGVMKENYQSFLYGDETEIKKEGLLPLPAFPNLKRLGLSNSRGLQKDLRTIVGSAPNLSVINGLLEASIWGQESILPLSYYPLLKDLSIVLTWLTRSQLQILISHPVVEITFLTLYNCFLREGNPADPLFSSRIWEPSVITLLEQQAGRLLSLSCTVPQLRVICRDCRVPLKRLSSLVLAVGPTEGFIVSVPSALKSIPNFASVLPNLTHLSILAETEPTTLENGNLESSDLWDGSPTRTQCASLCNLSLNCFDRSLVVSRLATLESFLSLATAMPKVAEFSCNTDLFRFLLEELASQNECIPWDLSELTLFQVELDLLEWENLFHVLKPGRSSMSVKLILLSNCGNHMEKYATADDGHVIPWFSSKLAQEICTLHPGLEIYILCTSGQSISLTSFEHLGTSATAEKTDSHRYKIRFSAA